MGLNTKKLDEIFTLMDKVNQATVRGLFPQAGKEAVITKLQQEVLIVLDEVKKPEPAAKKIEPPEEKKPEVKK